MACRPVRRPLPIPVMFLSVVGVSLFLGACGAQEHYVIKEPTRPLSSFREIEVKPFGVSDDVASELQGKDRDDINQLAGMIAPELSELFRQAEWTSSTEAADRLIVDGKIVSYKPGNRALRYLVGFGAGSSKVIAEVEFKDASGNVLASSEFSGGVTMGAFGGTNADAVRRMADEIRDYVGKNAPMEAKR